MSCAAGFCLTALLSAPSRNVLASHTVEEGVTVHDYDPHPARAQIEQA